MYLFFIRSRGRKEDRRVQSSTWTSFLELGDEQAALLDAPLEPLALVVLLGGGGPVCRGDADEEGFVPGCSDAFGEAQEEAQAVLKRSSPLIFPFVRER